MAFARRVFYIAGVYGLIVLAPQYLLEERIGRDDPPAITHPEHFYGFIGVALAWQIAFLIVARDPARYRLMMIPSILEKISFAAATIALFAAGRLSAAVFGFGLVDLMWAVLFAVAFVKVSSSPADPAVR
jgi:hypothetical protein